MFSPNSIQRLYYDWIKNFDPEIEKMLKTEEFLKLISNHFTLISDIKSNLDNIFPFANHFHKIFDEIQRNTLVFFSIRKDSELSPFDIEYINGNTRLLHFRNKNAQNSENYPLLIIYATINRFHIMDIEPDKSVIKSLLKRGLDVYVLDWGYPSTFGDTSLEDYLKYVKEAVHHIQFKSRLQTNSNKRFLNFAQSLANHDDIYNRNDGINSNSKISIIGYCWGGLIALIYASLYNKNVKNLVLMATPFDLEKDKTILSAWAKAMDIDKYINEIGHFNGFIIDMGFVMRNPARNGFDKYVTLLRKLDDPKFLKMFLAVERWLYDTPIIPGKFLRQIIKDCYKNNLLIKNKLSR